MSRSNPHENGAVNPAVRWFEWNGEKGLVRYYDKDAKQNIECGSDFSFVLLDELGCVRGWHDASGSGIYSNEVKDTRSDVLVVRAFKSGTLAQGLYRDIKDRVNAEGGRYVANCYIAFKLDGVLSIGSLKFKGAALKAWMEFRKAHRAELYEKGIKIAGTEAGKKGRITFYTPTLKLQPLSAETQRAAIALDEALQAFLASYLKRPTSDRLEATAAHVATEEEPPPPDEYDGPPPDDDIPF